MLEGRALGPEDADELAAFRCARPGEAWAEEIEVSICDALASLLGLGNGFEARGLWLDGLLVAVIAWEPARWTDDTWQSTLLAVHVDHRREGHARRLKRDLLDDAQAAGISVVLSKVRLDNAPMLALNKHRFAAKLRADYESGYVYCSIKV